MSYALFLLLFLCTPLLAVAVVMRRLYDRRVLTALTCVSVVAIVYTGPWDNAIIVNGVWTYGAHQVAGLLIGHVPLEEYLFYVLQVALTGSVTVWLLGRRDR